MRAERSDPSSSDKTPFAAGALAALCEPECLWPSYLWCCGNCEMDTEWVHTTAHTSQRSQPAPQSMPGRAGPAQSNRVPRDRLSGVPNVGAHGWTRPRAAVLSGSKVHPLPRRARAACNDGLERHLNCSRTMSYDAGTRMTSRPAVALQSLLAPAESHLRRRAGAAVPMMGRGPGFVWLLDGVVFVHMRPEAGDACGIF